MFRLMPGPDFRSELSIGFEHSCTPFRRQHRGSFARQSDPNKGLNRDEHVSASNEMAKDRRKGRYYRTWRISTMRIQLRSVIRASRRESAACECNLSLKETR